MNETFLFRVAAKTKKHLFCCLLSTSDGE